MIAGLAVLGALVVATAAFAVSHRSDRRANRVLDDHWGSFMGGAVELEVAVVGSPGGSVTLGQRVSSHPLVLTSSGFALRDDDGRVVNVAAGTRVTFHGKDVEINGDVVEVAAGTRLVARLRPINDETGPFRQDGRAWQIPDDGLLLSAEELSAFPKAWAARPVHRANLAAFWVIGGVFAGLALLHPKLEIFGIVYAILLGADAVFFRGSGMFWYAATRDPDS